MFQGIIHVTGEPDTGKTSFALECGADPARIAFIDADVKGRATVMQLLADGVKFGRYIPWIEKSRGMKEREMFSLGVSIIKELHPGEFDAVVWDTWTEFENTFKPVVSADPKRFREQWSPMGTIKGAEEWQTANDLEAEILDELNQRVPLVLLVTHLKSVSMGGKRVEGKWQPACKNPLTTKSLFRIWLRRNPSGRPVPVGLVLKRLSKKVLTEGHLRTVNILPQRLTPRPEDSSLWDLVNYYWEHPWGDRALTDADALTEYELSILENTLTKDQQLAMRMALVEAETDLAEAQRLVNVSKVRELQEIETSVRMALAEGRTNDEVLVAVPDASIPLVLKLRKELAGE